MINIKILSQDDVIGSEGQRRGAALDRVSGNHPAMSLIGEGKSMGVGSKPLGMV